MSFVFEMWYVQFLRFLLSVTSRWRRDKAVGLEKGLLLRFLQFKQFQYWERCLEVYILAREEGEIACIAEVIFGRHVGAHANGHQHGVAILSYIFAINLGEKFRQITQERCVIQT